MESPHRTGAGAAMQLFWNYPLYGCRDGRSFTVLGLAKDERDQDDVEEIPEHDHERDADPRDDLGGCDEAATGLPAT